MIRRSLIVLSNVSTKNAPAATTSGVTPTVAKAVSLEESKTAIPNTTSTTETMTPWEGWFSSWLRANVGDKFVDFWTFRPDDQHNLEQMYRPATKVQLTEDGQTAMFRHPSPGSQTPVRMPDADKGHYREDPYNVAYYPTDTRRRRQDPAFPNPEKEMLRLELMDPEDPRVQEAKKKLEEGPGSSPGNKGQFATGKSDYDPTGLRATMSTSHAAMNEQLDKVMPNHLPRYSWMDRVDEIVAWHEERDLPLPPGGYEHTYIPPKGRIARW